MTTNTSKQDKPKAVRLNDINPLLILLDDPVGFIKDKLEVKRPTPKEIIRARKEAYSQGFTTATKELPNLKERIELLELALADILDNEKEEILIRINEIEEMFIKSKNTDGNFGLSTEVLAQRKKELEAELNQQLEDLLATKSKAKGEN